MPNVYQCERCKVPLQGDARLCLYCLAACTRPCHECMQRWANGTWHPRRDKHGLRVPCNRCGNDGWVTEWPEGVPWPPSATARLE